MKTCRKYLDPLLSYPYVAIIPLIALSALLGWVSEKLEKKRETQSNPT